MRENPYALPHERYETFLHDLERDFDVAAAHHSQLDTHNFVQVTLRYCLFVGAEYGQIWR